MKRQLLGKQKKMGIEQAKMQLLLDEIDRHEDASNFDIGRAGAPSISLDATSIAALHALLNAHYTASRERDLSAQRWPLNFDNDGDGMDADEAYWRAVECQAVWKQTLQVITTWWEIHVIQQMQQVPPNTKTVI